MDIILWCMLKYDAWVYDGFVVGGEDMDVIISQE
jgi:hypothetical protein